MLLSKQPGIHRQTSGLPFRCLTYNILANKYAIGGYVFKCLVNNKYARARTHTHTHTHTHTTHNTHTHTHIHTRTHAHTHTRTHTHTHARMHAHSHTHTGMHASTHPCMHTRTHTHALKHALTRPQTRTHAHVHTHMHTLIYTHIPKHTRAHSHTQTHTLPHTQTCRTHTSCHSLKWALTSARTHLWTCAYRWHNYCPAPALSWPYRWELIKKQLVKPWDIVCLQEVTFYLSSISAMKACHILHLPTLSLLLLMSLRDHGWACQRISSSCPLNSLRFSPPLAPLPVDAARLNDRCLSMICNHLWRVEGCRAGTSQNKKDKKLRA